MGPDIADLNRDAAAQFPLYVDGILMNARRLRVRINQVAEARTDADRATLGVAYRGKGNGLVSTSVVDLPVMSVTFA